MLIERVSDAVIFDGPLTSTPVPAGPPRNQRTIMAGDDNPRMAASQLQAVPHKISTKPMDLLMKSWEITVNSPCVLEYAMKSIPGAVWARNPSIFRCDRACAVTIYSSNRLHLPLSRSAGNDAPKRAAERRLGQPRRASAASCGSVRCPRGSRSYTPRRAGRSEPCGERAFLASPTAPR